MCTISTGISTEPYPLPLKTNRTKLLQSKISDLAERGRNVLLDLTEHMVTLIKIYA